MKKKTSKKSVAIQGGRLIYFDEVSALRRMAEGLDFEDKTCRCSGCLMQEEFARKLRKLANWVDKHGAEVAKDMLRMQQGKQ